MRELKIEEKRIVNVQLIKCYFLGYFHLDFCWHVGLTGATCDETCSNVNSANEALGAANVFQEGDCTILDHFNANQGFGLSGSGSGGGGTGAMTFGYFYTTGSTRYCTKYGTSEIGTKIGEDNNSNTRRLVCACSGNRYLNLVTSCVIWLKIYAFSTILLIKKSMFY